MEPYHFPIMTESNVARNHNFNVQWSHCAMSSPLPFFFEKGPVLANCLVKIKVMDHFYPVLCRIKLYKNGPGPPGGSHGPYLRDTIIPQQKYPDFIKFMVVHQFLDHFYPVLSRTKLNKNGPVMDNAFQKWIKMRAG